jgi:MFS family permease
VALSDANRASGGYHRVLRSGVFWRLVPLNFFMTGSLLATQGLWGGLFVRDVLGVTGLGFGHYLSVLALGVSLGYLASGWVADRFGMGRVTVGAASGFLVANLALVAATWAPSVLLVLFAFASFGFFGAFQMLLLVQAGLAFPSTLTGRAVSGVNLFGIGAGALLQYGMGAVIALFPRDMQGSYPPSAYRVAFLITTVGVAVALAVFLPLAKSRRSTVRS